jgi:ABC-type transporter lipoprotein component MlaA
MRTRVKFGSILLLTLFVVPAFGQTGPAQPPDKTIAVFGQTIHYWDVGSGPVVVLVHGLGSRKEDWLPVVAPLAQKYRVLVPDQIGSGIPISR